jgi:hypothetical protein
MGMADIAEVLWNDYLRHNPATHWFNRDRFVLSNGHGSMLIYALLHLSGYDLPIEQLKLFRQLPATPPATRNATRPRAWKPPPARWARASPMPWASPWPRSCWHSVQPPGARSRRPPHLCSWAMAA